MLKITVNSAQANSQEGKTFEVTKEKEEVKLNGESFVWDILPQQANSFHVIHNHQSYQVDVLKADYQDKSFTLQINGRQYSINAEDKLDMLLKRLGMDNLNQNKVNDIKAPMPGLVLSINVAEGDEVKKGDSVLILEAMKMENVLKSPTDGKVKAVKVNQGQNVEKNQLMIVFE